MRRLGAWAYNIAFFPFVVILAYSLVLFNRKVRRGLRGRRRTLGRVRQFKERSVDAYGPLYWFHAASLGEFEQARPIIEGLKEVSPDAQVVVSFFSPSGYENCHHELIDFKFYLPLDFPWVMRSILRILKPHRVLFASYDIWPNLIWACQQAGIPTILFAARIIPGSSKQWPVLRRFYRTLYRSMSAIYTVSAGDEERLRAIMGSPSSTTVLNLGNPRYDRVKARQRGTLAANGERSNTIVLGSIHPEDEDVIYDPLLRLLENNGALKVIWAPHDPEPEVIDALAERLSSAGVKCSYYARSNGQFGDYQVLLVDGVGYLAELYYHGVVAYVGGGFGAQIHNVMEPAIASVPVFFGPRHHKSDEAEQLLSAGGGISISGGEEFGRQLTAIMGDPESREQMGHQAYRVIENNLGAAARIVQAILAD